MRAAVLLRTGLRCQSNAARPDPPSSGRGPGVQGVGGRPHAAHRQDPRAAPHHRRSAPRPASPAQKSVFATGDTDGWQSTAGCELGTAGWERRPLPPAYQWIPPVLPADDSPRQKGKRVQAEAQGGWTGRKEDEVRILSSWKGTGGAWTWRVVDSELLLDSSGFDVTRNAQTKPWCSATAGALLTTGFHEWEVRLTGNTRAVRIGVASPGVSLHDNLAWGREAPQAWVLTDMGSLWHNETLVSRCDTFRRSGDVVTLYCDMDTHTLRFAINGKKQAGSFSFLPPAGVVPVVCFREHPVTAEMRHVESTMPPRDTGPFSEGKVVRRGQVLPVEKKLPIQFQRHHDIRSGAQAAASPHRGSRWG